MDGYKFIEASEDDMREILLMCGCNHDQIRFCAAFILFILGVRNAEKRCRFCISTANVHARAPHKVCCVPPLSQLQRPIMMLRFTRLRSLFGHSKSTSFAELTASRQPHDDRVAQEYCASRHGLKLRTVGIHATWTDLHHTSTVSRCPAVL